MLRQIFADQPSNFTRCQNVEQVPESMCTVCMQTIVARDAEALLRAESSHRCASRTRRGRQSATTSSGFLAWLLAY